MKHKNDNSILLLLEDEKINLFRINSTKKVFNQKHYVHKFGEIKRIFRIPSNIAS